MVFIHRISLFFLLILLSISSILLSLIKGSAPITSHQFFSALSAPGDTTYDIIFNLRLPRTLTAFVTGSLLALAGSMMQILLRNPLADPYILGISGGAAVMSLLGILLGLSGYWMTGSAWLGSLITMMLTLLLTSGKSRWHPERLLLTGVALASGLSACISLILLLSPEKAAHSMLFWLMGDLSDAAFPWLALVILLLSSVCCFPLARAMNLLSHGAQTAKSLGVNTIHLQIKLYLLSSLLTATAVTLAGCIGFVGLIVPHLLRLMGCSDYRWMLPSAILLGGSLLTMADTLARIVSAPLELPVGIFTAVIGIPIFLILLRKDISHPCHS